jgi:hypothetical protein
LLVSQVAKDVLHHHHPTASAFRMGDSREIRRWQNE